MQHDRLSCPSPAPRACSSLCASSWWCHPTISSSVVPFFSRLQSFPASGSFPISQFFTSDGQSMRVSASASVLPMNIQGWFPLGLTGLISLQSKGLSKSLLQHHSSKASIRQCPASLFNFTVTWVLLFGIFITYFMIHQDLNGLTHLKFNYIHFFQLNVFFLIFNLREIKIIPGKNI